MIQITRLIHSLTNVVKAVEGMILRGVKPAS